MDDDFLIKLMIIVFVVVGFSAVIALAFGYSDPLTMMGVP